MQSCESLRIYDSGRYVFDVSRLSDAKLLTDDGCTFDIHRIILANCSDYFADLFCDIGRDKREFTIPGISGECLNNILRYAYTGDIQVTERNIKDLIIAADDLMMDKIFLERIRCDFEYKITELNCLGILKAAHQIDEDIFQECFRFVCTRFEGLVRRQMYELADLPLEVFRSILSNRSLYVYNETTVWQAIVEWTQKDIPSRMSCVPQLLLTLAMEDVGEELAMEILQHEIISKNSLMKDLKPLNDFTGNLDVLLSFMRSYSNPFLQPYSHRIPISLFIFFRRYGEAEGIYDMYVTYDENPDLCRKITRVERFNPYFLIGIGHKIYVFGIFCCMNFDLRTMEWVTMEHLNILTIGNRLCFHFETIDAFIYVLVEIMDVGTYLFKAYDTVNNRWSDVDLPPNMCYGTFVAIEKKIYLVGNNLGLDGTMMQMFDPVTQQWSLLSPPPVNRSQFGLLSYHKKIYLIGGRIRDEDVYCSNAEVFDPATNLWKELPNMPHPYCHAVVSNDQIIVFDKSYHKIERSVRWNDAMECWEILDELDPFNDLLEYALCFCPVHNVDTIRMITKQNRDPRTQMEPYWKIFKSSPSSS